MRDVFQRFRLTPTLVDEPIVPSLTVPGLIPGLSLTATQTGSEAKNVVSTQGFAEGRTVFHLPEAIAKADLAPLEPLVETDPDVAILAAALLRRFGVEHLPADASVAKRHALILQRLCVVRDTCTVVVTGLDRSVRLTMANGRVMVALFHLQGRKPRTISFSKQQTSKAAAREFAVLLAELCSGQVDFLMTETPVSGVFDGAAGIMVNDLLSEAGLGPAEAPVTLEVFVTEASKVA